jgi:hypothetical protein
MLLCIFKIMVVFLLNALFRLFLVNVFVIFGAREAEPDQ